MSLKITISHFHLADINDSKKRHYHGAIVIASNEPMSGAVKLAFYAVFNWAVSAKSLAFRCQINAVGSSIKAEHLYQDKFTKKLARDRVHVTSQRDTNFWTYDAAEKFLSEQVMLKMTDARKLINQIKITLNDDAKSFEDKIESEIADADSFDRKEKKAGVGEETAKKNPKWGMF